VATHQRCWSRSLTITDPVHVEVVAQLRTAFKARTAAMRGPMAAAGAQVGLRALSDYDDLFALNTPSPAASVVGRLVQYAGRILRTHPGKSTAEVHD